MRLPRLFQVGIVISLVWSKPAYGSACALLLAEGAQAVLAASEDGSAASPARPENERAADLQAYADAVRRTAFELELLGFAIEPRELEHRLGSEAVRQLAASVQCPAVIALSRAAQATEARVWVINTGEDRFLMTRIARELSSADVLAIRIAEFIQAGLLELDLPSPERDQGPAKGASAPEPPNSDASSAAGAGDLADRSTDGEPPRPSHAAVRVRPRSESLPAAEASQTVVTPRDSQRQEQFFEGRLGAAAGALVGLGDMAPVAAATLSAGFSVSSHWEAGVLGVLSRETSVGTARYRAHVSQQALLGFVGYRLWQDTAALWELVARTELGMYRLEATGQNAATARGTKDAAMVWMGGISSDLRRRLGRQLALSGALAVCWTTPRPVISLPQGGTRNSHQPLVMPRLGLELLW